MSTEYVIQILMGYDLDDNGYAMVSSPIWIEYGSQTIDRIAIYNEAKSYLGARQGKLA